MTNHDPTLDTMTKIRLLAATLAATLTLAAPAAANLCVHLDPHTCVQVANVHSEPHCG